MPPVQDRKLKFTNIMTKGIYVIIIVAFLSMGNKVEPRFSYSTKKRLCVCLFVVLTISTNNAKKKVSPEI